MVDAEREDEMEVVSGTPTTTSIVEMPTQLYFYDMDTGTSMDFEFSFTASDDFFSESLFSVRISSPISRAPSLEPGFSELPELNFSDGNDGNASSSTPAPARSPSPPSDTELKVKEFMDLMVLEVIIEVGIDTELKVKGYIFPIVDAHTALDNLSRELHELFENAKTKKSPGMVEREETCSPSLCYHCYFNADGDLFTPEPKTYWNFTVTKTVFNRTSPKIKHTPRFDNVAKICKGLDKASIAILNITSMVCNTFMVHIVQSRAPCMRPSLANVVDLKKSCTSLDACCRHPDCMSKSKVGLYSDSFIKDHIRGWKFAGKAFVSHGPLFYGDELYEIRYPLVHKAQNNGFGSFYHTIFLQSHRTGGEDYDLEIFQPPTITSKLEKEALLGSLLATMKQHFHRLFGKGLKNENINVKFINEFVDDQPDSRCESINTSQSSKSPPGPNCSPDGEEMRQQDSLKHGETHATNDGENVLSESGIRSVISYPANEGTRKTSKRKITLDDQQRLFGSCMDAEKSFEGNGSPDGEEMLQQDSLKHQLVEEKQDSLKHQLVEEMNGGENVLSESGIHNAVPYPENEGPRKTSKGKITLDDQQHLSGSRMDAEKSFEGNGSPHGEEMLQQDSLKHQLVEETHATNDGENVLSESGIHSAISYPANEGTRKTSKRKIILEDRQCFSGSCMDAAKSFEGNGSPDGEEMPEQDSLKHQLVGETHATNDGENVLSEAGIHNAVSYPENEGTRKRSKRKQISRVGTSRRKQRKDKIPISGEDLLNYLRNSTCTLKDAADFFHVSLATIESRCREFEIKRQDWKIDKNNQSVSKPKDIIESVQREGAEMGNQMAGGSRSCERELSHEQIGIPPESEKGSDRSQVGVGLMGESSTRIMEITPARDISACLRPDSVNITMPQTPEGELLIDHNISATEAVLVPESRQTNLSFSDPAPKLSNTTTAHMMPLAKETQDVTIMAKYREDTVLFKLPLTSRFFELSDKVAKKHKLVGAFSIKYLYNENEWKLNPKKKKVWILLTDDEDLKECFNSSSSIIQLLIEKKPISGS